jgi:outer membrane murein-binding lipoprotein Lpp
MKKIMSLVTIICLTLLLVGCSNESLNDDITDLQTRIEELENTDQVESEITKLKEQIAALVTNDTAKQNEIEDLKLRLQTLEDLYFDGVLTIVLEDDLGSQKFRTVRFVEAEDQNLFQLLYSNLEVEFEESTIGKYITNIEGLNPKVGSYVSLYQNGEYATAGIEAIRYQDGDVFTFKVEWYDEVEKAVHTAINLFIENYVTDFINEEKIDYTVASALYHLGILQDYVRLEDVKTQYQDLASTNGQELFKAILIVSASGGNPTDVNGNNLIQQLVDLAPTGPWNATTNGAIAFNAYPHGIEATTYTTTMLDDLITTNTPKSAGLDMGGTTLMALSHYQDEAGVQTVIDDYLAFVKEKQLPSGGVDDPWSGDNSATLAQIILGLVANGIDPRDSQFVKENGDLLTRLMDFVQEDGSFKFQPESTEADLMFSTPQAFAALVAYQQFKNSDGAFNLYEFK